MISSIYDPYDILAFKLCTFKLLKKSSFAIFDLFALKKQYLIFFSLSFIPLFTQPLSYDVVKRLARYKNVVGMKYSSGYTDSHFYEADLRCANKSYFKKKKPDILALSALLATTMVEMKCEFFQVIVVGTPVTQS